MYRTVWQRGALHGGVFALQEGVDLVEGGPVGGLLLPALAHEPVQLAGAVRRPRQGLGRQEGGPGGGRRVERRLGRGGRARRRAGLVALDHARQDLRLAHRLPRPLLAQTGQLPKCDAEAVHVARAGPLVLLLLIRALCYALANL